MASLDLVANKFEATTGARAYDQIAWSAPPISKLVAVGGEGVHAIRHLGSSTKGTLQTRSRGDWRPDSLLLARRSCGMFEARAGGEFRSSTLARDLCCYLPHGTDADLEFPSLSQALILHFPPGFLNAHMDRSVDDALEPLLGFRNPALASIMGIVEQELASPGFGNDLMLDGLYRCIASVLARGPERRECAQPDRILISPVRLRRVLDYVDANLAEKITLKQLADVAGISMFHFTRIFKKTMNETPYQYVRTRRLLQAQLLIDGSKHSLVEISLLCGFANQAHFTAAFVKETGMSPGKFRQIVRPHN